MEDLMKQKNELFLQREIPRNIEGTCIELQY